MKLTKYIREAFVHSAMEDVPNINYIEMIRKEVVRASIAALPAPVRAAWLDEKTSQYVKTTFRHFAGQGISVPGADGNRWGNAPAMPALLAADKKLIDDLVAKHEAQDKQRAHLKNTLSAAASSATTRKALATLLPEFEKYLPADEPAACRTLPAVANIVADFSKAGWPKTAKKGAAK